MFRPDDEIVPPGVKILTHDVGFAVKVWVPVEKFILNHFKGLLLIAKVFSKKVIIIFFLSVYI